MFLWDVKEKLQFIKTLRYTYTYTCRTALLIIFNKGQMRIRTTITYSLFIFTAL